MLDNACITLLYGVTLMCGLIIFYFNLSLVVFQYSKQTPFFIRFGSILMGVAALFFLLKPVTFGFMFFLGYLILIAEERRKRPSKGSLHHV